MPVILKVDPEKPEQSIISAAVQIFREGGIIAYPTETFYGLGADGLNDQAVEKIFSIKGRDRKIPISVIIGEMNDLKCLVRDIPECASRLIDAFWPGALTLIFRASENIPPFLSSGSGKIGIRISSNPVAIALAKALCHPITSTSANISGAKECTSAGEVLTRIGEKIDAVIDGGHTPGGLGSTIVDITDQPPVILREGAIPCSLILPVLENR